MANKRIKDLASIKYEGFLPLDDENGTGKFNFSRLLSVFSRIFRDDVNYSAKQTVMYNAKMYVFKTDHTAGPWDSTQVEEINVGDFSQLRVLAVKYSASSSYAKNNVVFKNSVLYKAKHHIDAGTVWSDSDWEVFNLNIFNRDVVHSNGNSINLGYKLVDGCFVTLGDVGTSVSIDYSQNVSYKCLVFPVKTGDKFSFKGQGGSSARLWAFLDETNVIRQVANPNQYQSDYGTIIAEQDGFLVFNTSSLDPSNDIIFTPYDARTIEILSDEVHGFVCALDLLQYSLKNQYISFSDKSVGDVVDVGSYTGSTSYSSIVLPVKAGDMIQVKGTCGNAPRLWCLTDSSCTIKKLAEANYYSNKLTTIYVDADGYFIGDYNHSSATYPPVYNLIAGVSRIVDFISKNNTDFLKNNTISLNEYLIEGAVATCSLGEPVAVSGHESWRTLKFPCKTGDVFEIVGSGGTNAPLYAFTDGEDVTVVSDANLSVSTHKRIVAPNDGYFIYNSYITATSDVIYHYDNIGSIDTILLYDDYKYLDLTSIAAKGRYISLDYSVGAIVDDSVIFENSSYNFVKISVKSGDMIQMKNVSSGTSPRLWCLTNNNKVVLKIAAESSYYSNYFTIVVEQDGFFYGDFKSYSGDAEYKFIGSQNRINDVINLSYRSTAEINVANDDVCIENKNFIELKCVNTSGDTADLSTLETNKNIRVLIMNCKVGDKFIVTGHGATAYRLWAFVDDNGNVVSKSASLVVLDNVTVISPINGKFVMQSYVHSEPTQYRLLTNNKEFCQSQHNETQNKTDKLYRRIPNICKFSSFFDLKNYETEISGFDFEGNMLEQVQSKFDELVSLNTGYMSKVDAAQELGLNYPAYADYNTYMYKLEGGLDSMGNLNGRHPKKKVIIISGVHGDEIAAPVNAYIFAKNLCNVVDDIYFKLRTTCDFYIIPCVNGYGMEHMTRTNGNGVDINRNYPIAAWTEGGSGTSQLTGPSAGSEFETKIVTGMYNLIMPDVGIDHHNYANTQYQLYAVTSSEEASNIVYDVFTECSYCFIKNKPEYFGESFKIFNNASAPKNLASYEEGTANRWMFERGLVDGCTCEISNNINYRNGTPHTGNELRYAPVVWSIGEYTLKNMIVKMVQHSISLI